MEIKPLIYYFIPFIKVLEPKELADTIKDEIERYLEEIESALYKMSPTEREHLMEVLHIAFPEYFKKDFMS